MIRVHRWRLGALLALAVAGLMPLAGRAADDKPALDRTISDTLKDIHNRGVDLYNASDVAGAYRMFQGALLMARPLLAERPEAQKAIDSGLQKAEQNPRLDRRAWALHETIEDVRARLGPAATAKKPEMRQSQPPQRPELKPEEKKTEPAKPDVKKAEEKTTDEKKPDESGEVTGKIKFLGKPAPEGTITLVDAAGKKKSGEIKDGVYTVKGLANGEYRITVTDKNKAVPAKYGAAESSGLIIYVKKGKQSFDFDLAP